MKKGRHRRFEEARAFKLRTKPGSSERAEPCAECDAAPDEEHASWCRATEDEDGEVGTGEDEPGPNHASWAGADERVDWADDR